MVRPRSTGYVSGVAPGLRYVVTLPFRIGLQAGRMVLEPLAGAAGRVVDVAEDLIGRDGAGHDEPEARTAAEAGAPAATTDPDMPAATPVAEPRTAEPETYDDVAAAPGPPPGEAADAVSSPPPAVFDAPEIGIVEAAGSGPVPESEIDEPTHVSAEPVLVAESADIEAADGLHTDLHVQEPWDGYRQSTAGQIIEALEDCNPAQLGVVRLYESTHRARKTVLEAADRELARR